jgi:hypothetical protein
MARLCWTLRAEGSIYDPDGVAKRWPGRKGIQSREERIELSAIPHLMAARGRMQSTQSWTEAEFLIGFA